MLESRKQEIFDLVVGQIETAGRGGFAALVFFGAIRRRQPGPRFVTRAAWIGNIVAATGVLEDEFKEFRDEMTPEMKARLASSYPKWEEAMAPVWKQHLDQIDAELAATRAQTNG